MYKTLINCQVLCKHLNDHGWVIVDCRYDLSDKEMGRNAYRQSHIPGAVFADLHDDLSGPPVTDCGRHPLPAPQAMQALFIRLGISQDIQVVVYDNAGGSFAARLWWMLRFMGHEAVAVLDGGWPVWQQRGLPTASGEEINGPGNFHGQSRREWLVTVDKVTAAVLLVDSRDPVRYRGEAEPVDKVAGHIPGAINHFWKDNLDSNGLFKEPDMLRKEFLDFLGDTTAGDAVFYCGSGVTACHNLLAAAHAGLPAPQLYAGSWSEWCSDANRPVATG
ncbi:MAG: 3-mercaptopyruvate sulfurtransferase [Gammaproteobacteria bacterium]|nr:3-mercaptopyruvate sulfurtransferase [Gammaproteobacteria bacterium]